LRKVPFALLSATCAASHHEQEGQCDEVSGHPCHRHQAEIVKREAADCRSCAMPMLLVATTPE